MMFPPRGQTDGGEEEVEKVLLGAAADQPGVGSRPPGAKIGICQS